MHACYHVASILFKIFFPHLNILKYIGSLTNGSSVTVGSSLSASLFASFSLFVFLLTHSDSLSSVKLSSTIMLFDSSLSVELTYNRV